MKLWSRGLGRTEVDMDFRYYKVTRDMESGNVCIVGNMRSPVNWEFRIMMEPDDLAGFAKIVLTPSILIYVVKNIHRYVIYLFQRKKFIEEGDMEEKVMSAYENLVSSRSARGGRKHSEKTQACSA